MPSMNKLSNYRTTIAARNGNTCITYVSTVVVEFDAQNIILRTGGHSTVTTKRKMNQAARQFDLPYGVFQKDFRWFICIRNPAYTVGGDAPYWLDETFPFDDDVIQLDRTTGRPHDLAKAA